jgi:hypothetical protein
MKVNWYLSKNTFLQMGYSTEWELITGCACAFREGVENTDYNKMID